MERIRVAILGVPVFHGNLQARNAEDRLKSCTSACVRRGDFVQDGAVVRFRPLIKKGATIRGRAILSLGGCRFSLLSVFHVHWGLGIAWYESASLFNGKPKKTIL